MIIQYCRSWSLEEYFQVVYPFESLSQGLDHDLPPFPRLPPIVLLLKIFDQAPLAQAHDLIVCIMFSLLLWLIPYRDMRIPVALAFVYPLTILAIEWVAIQSLRHSLIGTLNLEGAGDLQIALEVAVVLSINTVKWINTLN